MVLYIEYLLIDNLVIDYCLIRLLSRIFKESYDKINIALALLLGIIGAVFLPYVIKYVVLSIVYRLMVALIMILLLKRYKSHKAIMSRLMCFMGCTALIAGLIVGVLNALNIRYTISGVMLYDLEMPMGILVLFVISIMFVLDRILKTLLKTLSRSRYICDMEIEDNGTIINIKGYYDSGNMVSIDGESVSIISIDSFLRLYKCISLINLIEGKLDGLEKIKYINVGSVGGKEKLLSFVVDRVILEGKEYRAQRLAVAYKNFDDFDCILSSNYLGVAK